MGIKIETAELITRVCNSIDSSGTLRVLDVGCGDKTYKKFVGDNEYIGIDVEQSGRIESKKIPDIFFNGHDIPLEDDSVDVILFLEVLEHVTKPEDLMIDMRRVLKDSGTLILSVPFIWPLHEEPYDFRRFTSHGIYDFSQRFGFEVKQFNTLYSGWLGISKLFNSLANKNYKINFFVLKFIAIGSRAMAHIAKEAVPEFYLTNLVTLTKAKTTPMP